VSGWGCGGRPVLRNTPISSDRGCGQRLSFHEAGVRGADNGSRQRNYHAQHRRRGARNCEMRGSRWYPRIECDFLEDIKRKHSITAGDTESVWSYAARPETT